MITEKGIELMKTAGSPIMGASITGSSAIIGPDGRILSEPKTANEQLVVADLDLSLVTKTKTFADASGHCRFLHLSACGKMLIIPTDSRPDMLWLGADERSKRVVRVDI